MLKLGILDQSPVLTGEGAAEALRHTLALAQGADRLGYTRFWVSEHHNAKGLAGSSPEVLLAAIGAHTSRIRIGSGGVLLPHYSPYKVAENFRLLEGLYPGRVDLGIGRAPGGMPLVSQALGRSSGKEREEAFERSLTELGSFVGTGTPLETEHPLAGLSATPDVPTVPDVWMLGSSGYSATVAAKLGARFAFAHFINGHGGQSAVRDYLRHYRPGPLGGKPGVAVCVFVLCGEDDEEAEREARALDLRLLYLEQGEFNRAVPSDEEAERYAYSAWDRARIADNRSRMIVGGPATVARLLPAFARSYGADEVIVTCMMSRADRRLRSYERLARLFIR
ncbi:LLM class flavin-dependent oxidoreductase [Cohnella nanjingensis]|uniref:LLM class flavin-dependent oxidoreductase n=1 Tax=Cohnella nanjingensis TaxID=1387779 RepID=A0A7X0RNU0_9BACL|nr:LLM class flavin-dependent oxidoreductase [Cohnella nanjingensis]MBB6669660.1 LLM class flavin-dependent oxidoreductase [Cohnella nanjingensis]